MNCSTCLLLANKYTQAARVNIKCNEVKKGVIFEKKMFQIIARFSYLCEYGYDRRGCCWAGHNESVVLGAILGSEADGRRGREQDEVTTEGEED